MGTCEPSHLLSYRKLGRTSLYAVNDAENFLSVINGLEHTLVPCGRPFLACLECFPLWNVREKGVMLIDVDRHQQHRV